MADFRAGRDRDRVRLLQPVDVEQLERRIRRLEVTTVTTSAPPAPVPPNEIDTPYIVVAASDAPVEWKEAARYVCEGTADDQKIRDALHTPESQSGPTVLLSPGTFFLANTIALNIVSGGRTRLVGHGRRQTVLRSEFGVSWAGKTMVEMFDASVEHLSIDVAGAVGTPSALVAAHQGSVVENCDLSVQMTTGIVSAGATVRNCVIHGITIDGAGIVAESGTRVVGCELRNLEVGIHTNPNTLGDHNVLVTQCRFDSCMAGISVYNATGFTISNNQFEGVKEVAIRCEAAPEIYCEALLITGNFIDVSDHDLPSWSAIDVDYLFGSRISNNVITGITGTPLAGVRVRSSCNKVWVDGNDSSSSGVTTPVLDEGTDTLLGTNR